MGCVTAPQIFCANIFYHIGFIIQCFYLFLFPIRDQKDNIIDTHTDNQLLKQHKLDTNSTQLNQTQHDSNRNHNFSEH